MPSNDGVPWDYPLSDTLEGRLLEATVLRLQGLGLPGIAASRIVIQKLAWISDDAQLPTPCLIVSPAPETANWQAGTNERDEPVFGFFAATILANGRDVSTRGMGLQLAWRQKIRRAFQNLSANRFAELTLDADGGETFCGGSIESGDKFIESAKRDQRDAQYYVIRLRAREGRAP